MRKFLTPLFAAGLAIGASIASHAITLPSAVVTLGDGESHDFSSLFAVTATGYSLPSASFTFTDGSMVTVSSTANTVASSLSYSFAVTNANGPETYDFNVATAVTPIAAGTAIRSSVSGSGTDNTGNGGTIAPTGSLTTVQQATGSGGSLGLDLGPSYTLAGSGSAPDFFTFGSYNTTGTLASATSSLGLHLGISVPGGGDVFSFTGRVTAVPEPGAFALVAGFAVPAIGLLRRRRKAGTPRSKKRALGVPALGLLRRRRK